jgi:hypothetical protein
MSIRLDDLTREYKFQSNELNNLTNKWKESENTNKQLIVELERNIQINRDLETQIKLGSENIFNEDMNNKFMKNIEEIKSINNYKEEADSNKIDSSIRIIEKLKEKVKKEQIRYNQVLGEYNKIMMDRNKLEKIFIDCVEETRKDIIHRRMKEALSIRANSSSSKLQQTEQKFKVDKNGSFLPSDKRKLIEYFLLKDEVIELIKDNIFKINEMNISPFKSKQNDYINTKSSFMKTDNKIFSQYLGKRTTVSNFANSFYQGRIKTPNLNYL